MPERRFVYEIVEAIGGFTVAEFLDRVSGVELSEWVALHQLRGEEEKARQRRERRGG